MKCLTDLAEFGWMVAGVIEGVVYICVLEFMDSLHSPVLPVSDWVQAFKRKSLMMIKF
jgi:hypothetical protein